MNRKPPGIGGALDFLGMNDKAQPGSQIQLWNQGANAALRMQGTNRARILGLSLSGQVHSIQCAHPILAR